MLLWVDSVNWTRLIAVSPRKDFPRSSTLLHGTSINTLKCNHRFHPCTFSTYIRSLFSAEPVTVKPLTVSMPKDDAPELLLVFLPLPEPKEAIDSIRQQFPTIEVAFVEIPPGTLEITDDVIPSG